ncbi:DUF599 domain-containing protein [Aureimonas populi]|uniref:DUF599 domain-containing protein n=1 Tax=Aureimonas populi TaxID=1701758 RepID=A0ABW5CQE8_9HYPH|nr:DUF599 family protein [Aureimonas populi]
MSIGDFFDIPNVIAFLLFVGGWGAYTFVTNHSEFSHRSLGGRMNDQRARWMETLLRRDLRMIDTGIMSGLQQGTGFFASACIFAIGGCFALIGSADQIAQIGADFPMHELLDRRLVEAKLFGLIVIFVHAFFKFAWAYRLFNYCSILIGAIPMRLDAEADPRRARSAVERALAMNRIAGRHFNSGLRAIFFGLAYLGWFLGPYVLIVATALVIVILGHRQFFSDANEALRLTEDDT